MISELAAAKNLREGDSSMLVERDLARTELAESKANATDNLR